MVQLELCLDTMQDSKILVSIADQKTKVEDKLPFKYKVAEVPQTDGATFEIFVPKFKFD